MEDVETEQEFHLSWLHSEESQYELQALQESLLEYPHVSSLLENHTSDIIRLNKKNTQLLCVTWKSG